MDLTMRSYRLLLVAAVFLLSGAACYADEKPVSVVKVSSEPIHSGRITNMVYGGFIELLDDLVPGMWAEMLNDRGFEGVKPTNWFYYTGEPNTCDREWEMSDCCSYDTAEPFNGKQSVRITLNKPTSDILCQQGLFVKSGCEYQFSGYFKADSPGLRAEVVLKSLLPDGSWMVLGSASLPKLPDKWGKAGCKIKSRGTTDRAVFELKVTGSGILYADKLSLMPTDNKNGWRSDVVEVIKAAKPGVIRFGGSLHEFGYKWQQGLGDRDLRAPFWNQYWGRWETHDMGIDEFIAFCHLVGAEPLICVSFNEGLKNACDLVEYCNGDINTTWGRKRAENGHPEPYDVKYWQIGNECWGEKYDRACVHWCRAIRNVDPDAVLLAADDTPLLLEKAGQYLDYVGHHYYYMRDAGSCQTSIKEQQKIVKNAKLDHEVKMAITEWNVSAADWGLRRGKMLTLACGLDTAEWMNVLHNCSDFVGIACRSNMTNSMCSGYIVTRQSGILKTPSYLVMKLYADHYKPVPIKVAANVKGLDISACRSDNGKNLTVFAVNTTDSPMTIQLDLSNYPGFKPVNGEVVCDTLDRRQLDLMNCWETPERVRAINLSVTGDTIVLPAYSSAAIECAKPKK